MQPCCNACLCICVCLSLHPLAVLQQDPLTWDEPVTPSAHSAQAICSPTPWLLQQRVLELQEGPSQPLWHRSAQTSSIPEEQGYVEPLRGSKGPLWALLQPVLLGHLLGHQRDQLHP